MSDNRGIGMKNTALQDFERVYLGSVKCWAIFYEKNKAKGTSSSGTPRLQSLHARDNS